MKRSFLVRVLAVVLALPLIAYAGSDPISNSTTVPASITVPESMSMAVTGGPFVIPPNGTPSNTVTVTYGYSLIAASHTQGIWAITWFSSSTAALANGSVNIPSSAISQSKTGAAYAPCTGTTSQNSVGVSGAICSNVNDIASITSNPVVAANAWSDTYNLEYTAGGLLAPGTYSGTWNVEMLAP